MSWIRLHGTHSGTCLHLGLLMLGFTWDPRLWGLDWHGPASPCCWLWIDIGPFELMIGKKEKKEAEP